MSYELKAILEYDEARLEIKRLTKAISDSTTVFHGATFVGRACQCEGDQCFEKLWDWNKKIREYNRWNNSIYPYEEDGDQPPLPDGDEPPELCEHCKITQSLVDQRKEAKKRFGIAKVRLSRIARDHRNSTVLEVQ